jgi:hypothetical protein
MRVWRRRCVIASLVRDKLLARAARGDLEQDFAMPGREAERGAGIA